MKMSCHHGFYDNGDGLLCIPSDKGDSISGVRLVLSDSGHYILPLSALSGTTPSDKQANEDTHTMQQQRAHFMTIAASVPESEHSSTLKATGGSSALCSGGSQTSDPSFRCGPPPLVNQHSATEEEPSWSQEELESELALQQMGESQLHFRTSSPKELYSHSVSVSPPLNTWTTQHPPGLDAHVTAIPPCGAQSEDHQGIEDFPLDCCSPCDSDHNLVCNE